MFETIKADIKSVRERDPAVKSDLEVFFLYPSFKAVRAYRRAHKWYLKKHYFIARWISQRALHKTGIEIHPGATIGKGLFIDHGSGVVICETTENSKNLTCTARLFPALGMVWLGLRLQCAKELSANVSHTIATVSGSVPGLFTPLQAIADYPTGGQATGGILNTGEVIVRSDTAIASGKYIYLSGIYSIKR